MFLGCRPVLPSISRAIFTRNCRIQGIEHKTVEEVQHTEANREAGAGDPHDFQHSRVPQLLGDTHVVELGWDELIVWLNAPK